MTRQGPSAITPAWRMVTAGAGLQFLQSLIFVHGFGAHVALLSSEMGWSKTALAGAAALQSVEGALLGPMTGWLADRYGSHRLVTVGVVLWAVGLAWFGNVQTLSGLYVSMVLMSLGMTACGWLPFSVAIARAFRTSRARALSLLTAGLALGGLALPVLTSAMAEFGRQQTTLACSGLVLFLGLPLARTLRIVETSPGDQARSDAVDGYVAAHDQPGSFTMGAAIRTRAFWLLACGHGLALLVVSAVNVHAMSHLTEGLGLSLHEASLAITAMTLAQSAGIALGAAIGDRWNKCHLAAVCMVAHMAGVLVMAGAHDAASLLLFAALHGGAWGLRQPIMQAIRAEVFGVRAIGAIMGASAVVVAIGSVCGPLVAGELADGLGDYKTAFQLLGVLAGAGAGAFLMVRRPADVTWRG